MIFKSEGKQSDLNGFLDSGSHVHGELRFQTSFRVDGTFRENVFVQVKNGPLDFQPREPFHPLFGAMRQTPVIAEIQATQEYLGQAKQSNQASFG